jgi:hypothetical protein
MVETAQRMAVSHDPVAELQPAESTLDDRRSPTDPQHDGSLAAAEIPSPGLTLGR